MFQCKIRVKFDQTIMVIEDRVGFFYSPLDSA